ncbi:MAG: hypothetical protein C5B49_13235 [Bdellovibrio sp.]|nr:MAG: hypothetical protein C5B49_13235 [Bdellovibrio sp.]
MDELARPTEWLLSNRWGSFAMGCFDRLPRRKYHSLLTVREPIQSECLNVVSEVIEELRPQTTSGVRPRLLDLDFGSGAGTVGRSCLVEVASRAHEVRWFYSFPWGDLERRLLLIDEPEGLRLTYNARFFEDVEIRLCPLFLVRPWHRLTSANPVLDGRLGEFAADQPEKDQALWKFKPYAGLSSFAILVHGQGQRPRFDQEGVWFRGLFYPQEEERGYPAREDLYSPGWFTVALSKGESEFSLGVFDLRDQAAPAPAPAPAPAEAQPPAMAVPTRAGRRAAQAGQPTLEAKLFESAGQYLMNHRSGLPGVVAGFPWFEVWARDTFVALPGLCYWNGQSQLVKQRRDFGLQLLESWGKVLLEKKDLSRGLRQVSPEAPVNATGFDVPLFYFRALQLLRSELPSVWRSHKDRFLRSAFALVKELFAGTWNPQLRVTNGAYRVLANPRPSGWMDAIVDGRPVTPRFGLAVDLQALFITALSWLLEESPGTADRRSMQDALETAAPQFSSIFTAENHPHLADAVDDVGDFSLRPNQLWALASPVALLTNRVRKSALQAVRDQLRVPMGLRTLSPFDPRYRGLYVGPQPARDQAYHQGTVWPWLLGIYAEALVQVHGTAEAQRDLNPSVQILCQQLESGPCFGHVSEIFDGDVPHAARGAPAQAWSVAELIRLRRMLNL